MKEAEKQAKTEAGVSLADALGLDIQGSEARLIAILENVRDNYKGNFPDFLKAQKLTNKEKNLILMGVYWSVVVENAEKGG
jgi:hypothetical protein